MSAHRTVIQGPVKREPVSFHNSPWTVTAHKSHILQSTCSTPSVCGECVSGDDGCLETLCGFCRYDRELTLPSLPEMVFADNFLRIKHDRGFGIEFTALDALRLVDDKHDLMKVAVSIAWKEARADCEHIKDVVKPFDWTYSTDYKGTLIGASMLTASPTTEKVDIEKLKQREEILFYEDIHLYEDELADNGCSSLSVKIRVMPLCFFVLLRFYLRVDNVLIRVCDTRLYHEFGKEFLIREYSTRESHVAELKVPPAVLTDPNEICQHLSLKEETVEKLEFPS